ETAEYACRTAWSLLRAGGKIREKLKDTGMWKLYTDMELPLSYILYDMQKAGIRVLPDKLREYGQQLEGRIAELEKQIQEEAGCEFNIASPRQLGEILFEKMFLPGAKKTKTGYSTSADILEKLAP
ncbi:MAG TPA: DNA polymerase I, partial [Lachnospiraceae bacterium]|nr:DNA polymerase I [Lachnospiraceae bacterium]